MATKLKPLRPREARFVIAYLGQANGNGTKAATLAGYAPKNAAVQASQLLRRPKIAAALKEAQDARNFTPKASALMTAAERDAQLSDIARNPEATLDQQMTAIKELNKVEGRHIVRIEGELDVVHHTPESLTKLSDRELADLMEREGKAALALAEELRANALALPATAEPEKKPATARITKKSGV